MFYFSLIMAVFTFDGQNHHVLDFGMTYQDCLELKAGWTENNASEYVQFTCEGESI